MTDERTTIDADVRFPTATELGGETDAELLKRIAELYEELDARDLQPLWTQNERLMGLEPRPEAIPYLWKKKVLWEMAERAGELITIRRGGDRRVLSLANPGLGGQPFATPTLWGAIQYLNPHESAPGHRHTPGAIRFVMEGAGTWTTVNGDACDMGEGDLILTPPWHWHDHSNDSDGRMVWFDGLDLPFVKMVNAIFFEQYPVEELQPVKGHNVSERVYGGRATVPLAEHGESTPHSPLLVYRYSDTDSMLAALLEERGGPMVSLMYTNPLNGRSVMPTLDCEMHRVVAGGRTSARRKVGSSIFVVFRGTGATVIDGQRFAWEPGDMFAVPSWCVIDHEAEEDADLFAISDAPIMKALDLYREEELEGAQQVTDTFEAREN
jgi:gentisate 1,2-dioxygenase